MAKDENNAPAVEELPRQNEAGESGDVKDAKDIKEAIQSSDSPDVDVEELTRRAFSDNLRKEYKPRRKRGLALTLIALVAVLGVVSGLVYVATMYKPPEIVKPDTTVALMDFTTEEIESVTITPREGEAFTVAYDTASEKYKVVGWDGAIPVNQSAMRDLYSSGRALTAQKTVEEGAQNLSGYGFDNPAARVTVKHINGQTFEFELGNRVPTDASWYLRKANENTVYAVASTVGTRFSQHSRDLRDLNVLSSVSLDYVNYVYLERPGEETIELRQGSSAITLAVWNFVQPEDIEADADAVTALCENISGISFAEFWETSTELSKYGLDEPSAVIMMKDTDGNSIHLEIGGPASENATYARIAGGSDIYTIANSNLEFLKTTTLTQLAFKFIAIVNIAVVDEVNLGFSDGTKSELIIDREPKLGEDGKQTTNNDGTLAVTDRFWVDGEEMDDGLFRKVYQDVIALSIKGEVKGEIASAPSVTIDFLFNNERERMKLEFYSYGQDFYAVSRDGGTPYFYTRKDSVDSLRNRIELLKAMPNTRDADKVSTLTMIQDGKMTVLERNAVGASVMEKLYTDVITATTSGMTAERFSGEPKLTFRFQYTDGREPVTLEYYAYNNGMLAFGTPGSSVRFYLSTSALDSRIDSILAAAQ